MSTAAPVSPAKKPVDKKDPKLTPPDEQFWIRYSPHYEMPLSWVGSGAIHILIFGLVVLMGIALPFLFRDNRPVEMDSVRLDASGGGGGNLRGAGDKSGNANGENIEEIKNQDDKKFDKKVDTTDLPNKTDVAVNLPSLKDPDIARLIDSNNQAVKDIQDMNRVTSDAIRRGLAPAKGEGGPGTGGGKGSGEGPGTGGGKGPGKEGALSVREQRMLRWTMSFDIRGGADYAAQLRALGVIIAVELPDEPGKARVYHRIDANARGDVEELSSIKRMPWIDGRRESVEALCGYMGIRQVPPRLIAYMTEEMEAKLLKLELNYAGRDEDRIKETVFKITPAGIGRYEPRVVQQR
jgi:hypothetical protein